MEEKERAGKVSQMKNHVNIDDLKNIFGYVAEKIIENESYLNEIDRKTGDGDHGTGMSLGFREVLREVPQMSPTFAEELFVTVGTILIDTMGGASGVLFGTMFISGNVKRCGHLTMNLEDFATMFRGSLDALKKRGKAQLGDKTMIDALEPAVLGLEESVKQKKCLADGWQEAADRAKQGMNHTKEMKASIGRAKYFGEKTVGIQDAGATSVWLIFSGISEWIQQNKAEWEKFVKKVVTVSLNPCIDKTIFVERITMGGTHKVTDVQNDISGKGINVGIALQHFKVPAICLGFNYSNGSKIVEKSLNDQEVDFDFVRVEGELRTNVKVFENETKTMTEFNEFGRFVEKESVDKLIQKIEDYFESTNILVLDGSVPQGVPNDIYKRITEMAVERGVITILDATGELLLEGIQARPYLIKPNIDEFQSTFGIEASDRNSIIAGARKIISQGVTYVCISMGREGALFVTKNRALYSKTLDIEIRGIQGAGDSMVAGFCTAIGKGASEEEMLRYAMAAAAGSLQYAGTKICTLEDLNHLMPKVEIEVVEEV